jgi:histidine kinase
LLIFLSIAVLMAVITYFHSHQAAYPPWWAPPAALPRGDYNHPALDQSQDEIGALAQDFERMRLSVKEKTEALEESRRRFQTLFEQVPCYISVQDKDFKLVAVNSMFDTVISAARSANTATRPTRGRTSVCPNCAVEKSFKDGKMHTAEETVVGKDGKSKRYSSTWPRPYWTATAKS